MKLYSGPLSLFAKKIEVALAEKNLSFERVLVPFSQTKGYAPKNPDVMAVNPKGQVPVLIDNAVTIYDSTIILEYLEDAYPEPSLYPQTPDARARCRLFDLCADEIMLVPLRALMHRTEPPDDSARRVELEIKAGAAEKFLAEQFAYLDAELESGRYFCGSFSIADISVFMSVFFAQRLGGPALRHTRRLADWYRTVGARPAFKRMVTETADADGELSAPVTGAFKDGP